MKASLLFLFSCLVLFSCSDNIKDDLIGEWVITKTESDCSQSQDYNDEETTASNGCATGNIVSNSGVTTDLDFCSRITFYENGEADVLSGDSGTSSIQTLPYLISDGIISICSDSMFCKEYTLVDGELRTTFKVIGTNTPLFDCIRTFTYKK